MLQMKILAPTLVLAMLLGITVREADAGCRRAGLRANREARHGLLKRLLPRLHHGGQGCTFCR